MMHVSCSSSLLSDSHQKICHQVSEEVRTLKEIAEQVSPVVQIWNFIIILLNKIFQPEIVTTKKRMTYI